MRAYERIYVGCYGGVGINRVHVLVDPDAGLPLRHKENLAMCNLLYPEGSMWVWADRPLNATGRLGHV